MVPPEFGTTPRTAQAPSFAPLTVATGAPYSAREALLGSGLTGGVRSFARSGGSQPVAPRCCLPRSDVLVLLIAYFHYGV